MRHNLNNSFKILGCVLLSLLVFTTIAIAQEPTFDQVNEVAKQLNCPTCQSINLADCRTQTCAQWRDQIKDMLAAGQTESEILDWYAAQYGDEVLQEPPRRGFGLYVWILPLAALLAGAAWLVFIVKKWSSPATATVPVQVSDTDKSDERDTYLKQVENDLQNL